MRGVKKALRYFINFIIVVLIAATLASVCAVAVGAVYLGKYKDVKMDMSLMKPTVGGVARLYYTESDGGVKEFEDGGLVGVRYSYVPISEIPKNLINAFVAIEDKRFFEHKGIDIFRTVRAGINYIFGNKRSFGGSTITQQLVKNLTGRDEYSLDRKFTEIFEALDLERRADKLQILQAYLNVINLANGCRGVGGAAELYFGKEVSELDLAECAAIAAITNNPSLYDPVSHPDNNRRRRELILDEMLSQGYITVDERDAARKETVTVSARAENDGRVSSWYTDTVISDVISDLIKKCGYTRAEANMAIYSGGLSIYTAMDQNIQRELEKYYSDKNNFPVGEGGLQPQSAMMVLDRYSGDILGVVGAIGEKNGNRIQNYATDTRRPAGSAIKPLSVYAPALELGIINWATVFDDVPLRFEGKDNTPWPRNADGVYRGYTTVSDAIKDSVNTVALRALGELGMERSFDFLKNKLRIKSLSPSDKNSVNDMTPASLALGQQSVGVSMRELVGGYTVFESGVYREPISYHKVVDSNGNIILDKKRESYENARVVLKKENAAIMTKLLEGVVRDGTAKKGITLDEELGISVAGKTGTTQNNCDRWFIGYTPRLLAGVWLGYDYPSELVGIEGNPSVRIWDDVMKDCERGYDRVPPKSSFDECGGIIKLSYCADSGKIPCPVCLEDPRGRRVCEGWFTVDNMPSELCDIHVLVEYDRVFGGVCLSEGVESTDTAGYVGLIRAERSFPRQIYVRDAQYVWRGRIPWEQASFEEGLPYFANILPEGEYCGISYTSRQFNRACVSHGQGNFAE